MAQINPQEAADRAQAAAEVARQAAEPPQQYPTPRLPWGDRGACGNRRHDRSISCFALDLHLRCSSVLVVWSVSRRCTRR